jgi:hypothetical protein
MSPRPNARIDIHAMLVAQLKKFLQIAISGPIELPLDLLVMDPDDITSQ